MAFSIEDVLNMKVSMFEGQSNIQETNYKDTNKALENNEGEDDEYGDFKYESDGNEDKY